MLNDDTSKANYLNKLFSTVVSDLLESIEQPQQVYEIPDIPLDQETLFPKPTSGNGVMRTIQNLKNKSGGGDEIHAFS